MKKILSMLSVVSLASFMVACDDDNNDNLPNRTIPEVPVSSNVDDMVVEANRFVKETMDDYYYWSEQMPKGLDYRLQENTEDYFYALRYSGDRFSFISDDADEYNESQEGISTSMGWECIYSTVNGQSNRVVSIINYVYRNTPAYNAGARRGDVVIAVDGQEMNIDNYRSLASKSSAKYTILRYDSDKAQADPNNPYVEIEYSIQSGKIETSPLAEHSVFEADGHKIGYLLYMDFYSAFNDEMGQVFAEFKSKGVDRMILDLRYNPGGEMTALECLCSHLAPKANVANNDLLIWYKYNSTLSQYSMFSKENSASSLKDSLADATLDLKSLVVITGTGSYSASEATIIALKPYMDVYTIGDVTGGKNTSMIIFTPADFTYNNSSKPYYNKGINNWLIAPIVATYFNSVDYTFDTSDGNGMAPDYSFNEYDLDNMGMLGEADEPLTALAIEYICNGSITANANKSLHEPRKVLSHGFNTTRGGAVMNHLKPLAQ